MFNLFLTCPRGLEDICRQELTKLGAINPTVKSGGVSFNGNLETVYRTNLFSRTGMHVLIEIIYFQYKNETHYYKEILKFDWGHYISPNTTFSINCHVHPKYQNKANAQYLILKAKDAIVDNVRTHSGQRPSINKISPDYPITIAIDTMGEVRIYFNSSGAPLNRRGYRHKIHKASLNESLAAGIIILSEWDKKQTFLDPMCGSGTFAIEATMLARKIPPGLNRKFSFMKWVDFNKELWVNTVENAKQSIDRISKLEIYASDISNANIRLSNQNAIRASVNKDIKFSVKDYFKSHPVTKSGKIVMNPPYGIRIESDVDIELLYKNIGDMLKQKYVGWDAHIFTANLTASKRFGLRPSSRIPLKNGTLDSRLLKFELYSGSKDAG